MWRAVGGRVRGPARPPSPHTSPIPPPPPSRREAPSRDAPGGRVVVDLAGARPSATRGRRGRGRGISGGGGGFPRRVPARRVPAAGGSRRGNPRRAPPAPRHSAPPQAVDGRVPPPAPPRHAATPPGRRRAGGHALRPRFDGRGSTAGVRRPGFHPEVRPRGPVAPRPKRWLPLQKTRSPQSELGSPSRSVTPHDRTLTTLSFFLAVEPPRGDIFLRSAPLIGCGPSQDPVAGHVFLRRCKRPGAREASWKSPSDPSSRMI